MKFIKKWWDKRQNFMIEELFEYCHNREKNFMYDLESKKSIFTTISFLWYDTKCMYHPYNTSRQYWNSWSKDAESYNCRKMKLEFCMILVECSACVFPSWFSQTLIDRSTSVISSSCECYSVSRKVDAPNEIYGRTLFAKIVSFSSW